MTEFMNEFDISAISNEAGTQLTVTWSLTVGTNQTVVAFGIEGLRSTATSGVEVVKTTPGTIYAFTANVVINTRWGRTDASITSSSQSRTYSFATNGTSPWTTNQFLTGPDYPGQELIPAPQRRGWFKSFFKNAVVNGETYYDYIKFDHIWHPEYERRYRQSNYILSSGSLPPGLTLKGLNGMGTSYSPEILDGPKNGNSYVTESRHVDYWKPNDAKLVLTGVPTATGTYTFTIDVRCNEHWGYYRLDNHYDNPDWWAELDPEALGRRYYHLQRGLIRSRVTITMTVGNNKNIKVKPENNVDTWVNGVVWVRNPDNDGWIKPTKLKVVKSKNPLVWQEVDNPDLPGA